MSELRQAATSAPSAGAGAQASDVLGKVERALWVLEEHNKLHFGEAHSTVAEASNALAALCCLRATPQAGSALTDGVGAGGATPEAAPVVREFTNELGNRIRITIEGPTSTSENVLTRREASELQLALAAVSDAGGGSAESVDGEPLLDGEGWEVTLANGHSGWGYHAHVADYPDEAVFVCAASPAGEPLCESCGGSGEREVFVQSGGSMPWNAGDGYNETVNCPACNGNGFARPSADSASREQSK